MHPKALKNRKCLYAISGRNCGRSQKQVGHPRPWCLVQNTCDPRYLEEETSGGEFSITQGDMRCLFRSLLAFLLVTYVTAWGSLGHRIVASIAQDRLSQASLNYLNALLNGTQYKTLVDLAPLPDEYGHQSVGRWSSTCHYTNIPKDATHYTVDMCGGCCVVSAVSNYTNLLRQEMASPQICNFGSSDEPCPIEFLTHFLGDLHQPLHVGYGYDAGGNAVKVAFYDKTTDSFNNPMNLHTIWDTEMIYKWSSNLKTAMTKMNQWIATNSDLVATFNSSLNPVVWADESISYTVNDVYTQTFDDSHPVDDTYYNQKIPIIMKRLAAGGVRLAATINAVTSNEDLGRNGTNVGPTRSLSSAPSAFAWTSLFLSSTHNLNHFLWS
ncbi:Nuclease S1 [Planoprotostelium fungivorum]|uniref:Nuclease S1 n=1 Tax=Planoprotostelium fungivorum TaxID=1890364 RepID=A0A2P6NMI6_9EUKA|nr:Nuclease S1 [Planoprotostelium fungivorum]